MDRIRVNVKVGVSSIIDKSFIFSLSMQMPDRLDGINQVTSKGQKKREKVHAGYDADSERNDL